MPETPEGRFVAATLDRWGVWHRAGMGGTVVGLDLGEALAALPQGADRAFAVRLLVVAETAFCGAAAKHWKAQSETAPSRG